MIDRFMLLKQEGSRANFQFDMFVVHAYYVFFENTVSCFIFSFLSLQIIIRKLIIKGFVVFKYFLRKSLF